MRKQLQLWQLYRIKHFWYNCAIRAIGSSQTKSTDSSNVESYQKIGNIETANDCLKGNFDDSC